MVQIKKNKVNIINFLLVLIGLFIFYRITQKSEFNYFLNRVNHYFLFSFFFFFLSIYSASIRFYIILKKKINILEILLLNIKSFFFYFFLPVGIGSDIYRFQILNKDLNKKKIQIFNIILIDRLFGLISFIFLSSFFFIFVIENYFLFPLLILFPIIFFGFDKILNHFESLRINYFNELRLKEILCVSFFSVLSQIFLIISIYLVILLYDFNFHFFHTGFVISFSSILSLIPLSLFGLSATELSSYTLYIFYGLNNNEALFLTINHYFLKFSFSIVGVILYLKHNIRINFSIRGKKLK